MSIRNRFDMHIHSSSSDGVLSCDEILLLAKENNVERLSITDHDTLAAYSTPCRQIKLGIDIIPGVELSTQWKGIGIHVLLYGEDLSGAALHNLVKAQQRVRSDRVIIISERLKKLGFGDPLPWLEARYPKSHLGRPHFAEYLVAVEAVKNTKAAFKRYLGAGKAGDVKHNWVSLERLLMVAQSSKASSILAHPLKYSMTNTKLKRLLADFAALGGSGIEVVSGRQQLHQTEYITRLAREMSLMVSSGSDFHSAEKSYCGIGQQSPLPLNCIPFWDFYDSV